MLLHIVDALLEQLEELTPSSFWSIFIYMYRQLTCAPFSGLFGVMTAVSSTVAMMLAMRGVSSLRKPNMI